MYCCGCGSGSLIRLRTRTISPRAGGSFGVRPRLATRMVHTKEAVGVGELTLGCRRRTRRRYRRRRHRRCRYAAVIQRLALTVVMCQWIPGAPTLCSRPNRQVQGKQKLLTSRQQYALPKKLSQAQ